LNEPPSVVDGRTGNWWMVTGGCDVTGEWAVGLSLLAELVVIGLSLLADLEVTGFSLLADLVVIRVRAAGFSLLTELVVIGLRHRNVVPFLHIAAEANLGDNYHGEHYYHGEQYYHGERYKEILPKEILKRYWEILLKEILKRYWEMLGTDISQKDEKPSKKRQNRTRDGKVCEDEA
ncbi:hypothetical protein Tco_1234214, partial [Tanacetum coccineum]